MSHFFGKGASNLQRGLPNGALYAAGTSSLFGVNEEAKVESRNPLENASNEFMTRFGLTRVITRNNNIVRTLSKPTESINDINSEYMKISVHMTELYNRYYRELMMQGVPQGLAQKRADEYILPLLDAELQILALKYPYNFGSSSNESNLHMQQILFKTPTSSNQSLADLNVLHSELKSHGMKREKKEKGM